LLYDTDSVSWNLYSLLGSGKTVLLDFFYASCVPCQTFTPEIEQLYQDYGAGTGDLIVLGISDRDNNAVLGSFAADYNVTYPSGGTKGNGNTITSLYMGWFSFSGWPQYAVVCTDTSIFWGVTPSIGMAALRNKIDTCDIVTSSRQLDLNHNISELKVSVYPQPADQSLSVHIENASRAHLKIKLLNLLGSVIKEYDLRNYMGSSRLVINTAELNSGTYLMQVEELGHTRRNVKIVVTH